MRLPKETLGVEELDRRSKTPRLAVHSICILATVHQQIPKEPLCSEEPERVRRHVAHSGSCIRSPRESVVRTTGAKY